MPEDYSFPLHWLFWGDACILALSIALSSPKSPSSCDATGRVWSPQAHRGLVSPRSSSRGAASGKYPKLAKGPPPVTPPLPHVLSIPEVIATRHRLTKKKGGGGLDWDHRHHWTT